METKQIIDRINSGGFDRSALIKMTNEASRTIKANAVAALAKQHGLDSSILAYLERYAAEPANAVPLMGNVKLSHWTVGCIFEIGSDDSRRVVKELLRGWPASDLDDLLWYLKSNVTGFAT